jgi:hypothetical protein
MVKVVEASTLAGLFAPLLGLYEPFRGSTWGHITRLAGNSLFDCIAQEDGWSLFNANLTEHEACELLDAIRGIKPGDGNVSSNNEWVARRQFSVANHQDWWDAFSKQLKYRRRFIPDTHDLSVGDPLKVLSLHLAKFNYTFAAGRLLYRARIGSEVNARTGELSPIKPGIKMGAPSPERATAGRGNPVGVSYLYTAEQEATAIQEVRPFVGARITVAQLETTKSLQLVNVAKIKHVVSPLLHRDLDSVLSGLEILRVLNEKLSQPIDPNAGHLEYLPTQYLAEVVLANGYDGIRYKSAIAEDGINVMLFDQCKTVVCQTKLVEIRGMGIKYRDLTGYGAKPAKRAVKR